jgi:hypothetical protein
MEYPELVMGVFAHRGHFAWAAGVTPGTLSVMVSNGDLPPLPTPINRMGGKDVFSAADVDIYRGMCERWRADAPRRIAAKRAAQDAYTRGVMEAEMARLGTEQRLAREMQAATDAGIAAELERQAQALKGIW